MKSYVWMPENVNINEILQVYGINNVEIVSSLLKQITYDRIDPDEVRNNVLVDLSIQISMLSFDDSVHLSASRVNEFLSHKRSGNYQLEDYVFYCLVFRKEDPYVEYIIEYLIKLDNEMRQMLLVFIRENGNVLKSSKLLYLHRNTLLYRIQKIGETLKIDLHSPRVIHSFSIIFELLTF